jgi:hypothetical protein
VTELDVQVTTLRGTEQQLKDITHDQELNVKALVELIEENQEIIDEKKQTIRQEIIASLMDTVLKGERDQSGEFSDAEIQRLIIYMRGLPAVTINELLLRKAIKKNRSMLSIINLVRDISREGVQEGDNIFIIKEEDEELQARFIETPE